MRELVLEMSVSIDGFVGGTDGALDWLFPRSTTGRSRRWWRMNEIPKVWFSPLWAADWACSTNCRRRAISHLSMSERSARERWLMFTGDARSATSAT